MKYYCLICFYLLLLSLPAASQDFVTRARIEFEKKDNIKKQMSFSNMPQDVIDRYPETVTTYYDFLYAGGQSLYKPGKEVPLPPSLPGRQSVNLPKDESVLFTNFITGKKILRKNVFQEDFLFEDSIPAISWKIGQETRKIAGYECRKAIGRIFDSVYLVAFYAEELVFKGGPEGVQGLPGMILGLAVPRYNKTWFATKVELANIDESQIAAPTLKGKKTSPAETKEKLVKKFEQMGVRDATKYVEGYFKKTYFF